MRLDLVSCLTSHVDLADTIHPLEIAVEAIEKITIADTGHLSDSWFWTEILAGLNGADVAFVDPSANDDEEGLLRCISRLRAGSLP